MLSAIAIQQYREIKLLTARLETLQQKMVKASELINHYKQHSTPQKSIFDLLAENDLMLDELNHIKEEGDRLLTEKGFIL